jgi:protein-tyrosine-phosphatase
MNERTLFVCRENTGRSQVAMAYYNEFNPGMSDSAGTEVENLDDLVGDRPEAVGIIAAMREEGLEIAANQRKPVIQEMLPKFGNVIIMAEPITVPDWLHDWRGSRYWTIPDLKDLRVSAAREIRNLIRDHVYDLMWQKQG